MATGIGSFQRLAHKGNRTGFTILELVVVVVIMGILLSYAVPRFQQAFEQSRADLAAANLQSIWAAQRIFRSQSNHYADSLDELEAANMVNTAALNKTGAAYSYSIENANLSGFSARATREHSNHWRGYFTVDETGALGGQVAGARGEVITPMQS